MSIHCCGNESEEKNREISKQYKSVLWIALVLNFSMFILENIHGLLSHSLSPNSPLHSLLLKSTTLNPNGRCPQYHPPLHP